MWNHHLEGCSKQVLQRGAGMGSSGWEGLWRPSCPNEEEGEAGRELDM